MVLVLSKYIRFLLPKYVTAIALWPFIIFRNMDKKDDLTIINHEKIHLKQQVELLVIPFYIIYLIEFMYHFLLIKNRFEAYKKISFEREAYKFENDKSYLKTRKFLAMWRNDEAIN
jgi:hypothetical protein